MLGSVIGYHSARALVARPFGIRIFPSSVEGVSVLGGVRTFYRGNARKRLTPVVRARVASWVITRKFDPPPPDSQQPPLVIKSRARKKK